MYSTLPSPKLLWTAWTVLMALTLGTMGAGRVTGADSLAASGVTALLLLAGLKVGIILWFYLNLRHSGRGWQKGFAVFLSLLIGSIIGLSLLTPGVPA
ncbi:hypothetical protein JCM17960_00830 [Magnetospira thiophila]